MASHVRFPSTVLTTLRDARFVGVRAGRVDHRFTGIWVVVVENRVFVRSWTMKLGGWYRTFVEEPHGAMQVDGREFRIRARVVTGERLTAAVDRAYLEKYTTRGSVKYARGLGRGRRRATTTELMPFRTARAPRRAARA